MIVDGSRVIGIIETDAVRSWRRYRLAAIDCLLGAIEEHNLVAGAEAQASEGLVLWYQVLSGVSWLPDQPFSGATLWETTLGLQNGLLLAPVDDPAIGRRRH